MTGLKYILDANVFIRAHREYYAPDFAPMFWDTLAEYAGRGTIGTIDKVENELKREKDPLWAWFKTEFTAAVFCTDEESVVEAYAQVIQWANRQEQFFPYAKHEFANEPDAWLIAFALAKGCAVVTHEKLQPDVRRRVPIPNVCQAFNVRYIDTFQLLRELKVRWSG